MADKAMEIPKMNIRQCISASALSATANFEGACNRFRYVATLLYPTGIGLQTRANIAALRYLHINLWALHTYV